MFAHGKKRKYNKQQTTLRLSCVFSKLTPLLVASSRELAPYFPETAIKICILISAMQPEVRHDTLLQPSHIRQCTLMSTKTYTENPDEKTK
jgi:hypothetical protein